MREFWQARRESRQVDPRQMPCDGVKRDDRQPDQPRAQPDGTSPRAIQFGQHLLRRGHGGDGLPQSASRLSTRRDFPDGNTGLHDRFVRRMGRSHEPGVVRR